MTPFEYTQLTQLLLDEKFKNWVNAPTKEGNAYWKEQIKQNPKLETLMGRGIPIVKWFMKESCLPQEKQG